MKISQTLQCSDFRLLAPLSVGRALASRCVKPTVAVRSAPQAHTSHCAHGHTAVDLHEMLLFSHVETTASVVQLEYPAAHSEVMPREHEMDCEVLVDRFDELAGSPDEARELVHLFLAVTSDDLDSLTAAMNAGNMWDIEMIAHRCAGASGVCGATDLMDLLRQVEEGAHSGDLGAAAIVLPQVSAMFRQVGAVLHAHFVRPSFDSAHALTDLAHAC